MIVQEGWIPHRKSPFTALVLIPPESTWEPIQAIRREHDPKIGRWMPHVTLLYPFVEPAYLTQAAEIARAVAESFLAFRLLLTELGYFTHGSRRATIWLRPDPPAPVVRLQAQLLERFPWCDDTSRFPEGFRPHLSVGLWPAGDAERAAARLQETWQRLEWQVEAFCLIARSPMGDDPFSVRHAVPLSVARS